VITKKPMSGKRKQLQRSPDAYLMNIRIMYDKKYFESLAHQQILKKMGFVK